MMPLTFPVCLLSLTVTLSLFLFVSCLLLLSSSLMFSFPRDNTPLWKSNTDVSSKLQSDSGQDSLTRTME